MAVAAWVAFQTVSERLNLPEAQLLLAEVEALDFTRASLDDVDSLMAQLRGVMSSLWYDTDRDEVLAKRFEEAHSRLYLLYSDLEAHDLPTRLEGIESRLEGVEKRLAEVEEASGTTSIAFRSLRAWATGIFGVLLGGWVLLTTEGMTFWPQIAMYGIGVGLTVLWTRIWRYW